MTAKRKTQKKHSRSQKSGLKLFRGGLPLHAAHAAPTPPL
uniref:Uncharacterized protein n=1 Tax=viral metagenome TaxID=1070528 RepID=A0A6C0H1Z9_9ZZZZ